MIPIIQLFAFVREFAHRHQSQAAFRAESFLGQLHPSALSSRDLQAAQKMGPPKNGY